MDDSQAVNIYWKYMKVIISISLSIALLELSGVDVTSGNIVSFEKFSLPVLILFSISINAFGNMLKSFDKWFSKKDNTGLSN